jgi:hypothetical protein
MQDLLIVVALDQVQDVAGTNLTTLQSLTNRLPLNTQNTASQPTNQPTNQPTAELNSNGLR